MAKSATSIEPGVLDELTRLGAERGPIAGWLEGLEARRESVSEPVYRRVREDYAKRIADLDGRARPLRIAATRTIAVFDEQLGQLATEKREVELDLQEIELRHRLEEYTDAEFENRARVPRGRIEELGLGLGQIRATRELWLAARGEEIADSAAPETPAPPTALPAGGATAAVHVAPVALSTPALAPAMTAIPPMPPMPPTPAGVELRPASITMPRPIPPPRPSSPAIPLPHGADGATRIGDLPIPAPAAPPPAAPVGGLAPVAPLAPVTPPAQVAPPGLDRTVVYTPEPPSPEAAAGGSTLRLVATLVPVDGGEGAAQGYALTPENTIGRVRENSVQVAHGSVSRHHAILRFTAEGWMLEDLGAENGTWVNGERIQKRQLADGDRVNIGTVRFLFRVG